jgi:hypothetical protein
MCGFLLHVVYFTLLLHQTERRATSVQSIDPSIHPKRQTRPVPDWSLRHSRRFKIVAMGWI